MTSNFILIEDESPIAVVWLNEPERRNPLSPGLISDLFDGLTDIAENERFQVVVVTGTGAGFSSGADLTRMRVAQPLEDRDEYDAILGVNRLLWRYPKPTIAAVHGFALGAGANLMSWCDLALVEEDTRLGYPEVAAGVPSATVIPTLMRHVGRKRMLELVLTGQHIEPEVAERIGLINRVVPRGTVLEAARSLASRIAQHDRTAVRLTKEIVHATTDMSYPHAIDYAKELRVIARLRPDFRPTVSKGRTDHDGRGEV